MRFFLLFLVALSLGFVAEGKVWAVIDTFATNVPPLFQSVDQQDYSPPYTWYSPYGEASGTPPAVSFIDTTDCLGGQRDLILGYQTDSASGSLAVMGVSQRAASIGFPLEYDGGAYFQWDGIDNAGTQNPFPGANLNAQPGIGSGGNPFGLSGGRMDFTFGGRAQGITMTVLADHEVFYYYDALDSFGTKYTLQNLVIPINDQTPVVLNVTFSDPRWNITAGASAFSWTNVVAFQVRALTFSDETGFSQAVDTSFKFLNITGYEIAGFVVVDCLCTGDNTNPQAGITMQLFGSTNSVLNTTVTDVNGQFAFYGYAPGSYRVCVDSSVNRCSNSPQCVSFFQDNDIDVPAIRFAATVTTTLTIPADRTLECGACTTPDCLGFANVTSCNGFQQLTTWNDTQTTSGCTTTIRRTWTSPDNTRSGTQTITVRDTQAPVITNPAQNLTQVCGSTSTSVDQWLSNQAGATATDCSLFSWTNNYQNNGPVQCGSVTVTFTARDVCGLQSNTTATFAITDNVAPQLNSPATDNRAECDTKGQTDQQQFTTWLNNRGGATATDTCSTSVSWSNNNTNTLTSGCLNQRTVQFVARDSCANQVTTIATFTISDTTAPTITRQASNASGACNSQSGSNQALNTFLSTHGGATATDNCIAQDSALVWTNDYQNGSVSGGCSSGVPVTFTVTDPCGLTATTVATFSISDNTPPTLTRPAAPQTVECGSDIQTAYSTWLNNNAGFQATDDCSAVTYSNNGTGVTVSNGCSNVYTVAFSAQDACNAQPVVSTSTFTVRDSTAPRFTTSPTSTGAECNSGVNDAFNAWLSSSANAVATDSCSAVTITNDYTGTGPQLGCNVITTVRFTARDACGLTSAAQAANFTVTDTTPPSIDVQAQPAAVECNSTTNQQSYSSFLSTRGGAQASDICSSTVTWSNNGTGTISSGCNVVRYVQFTATDGCGRQASTVTTFTVQDTTAPVLTKGASDRSAECNGNTGNSADFNSWRSSHGGATATDNCGGVTWTDNFVGFTNDSTACTSSATVTFTATDPCGFSVSTVATYTVTDNVGPSITTPAQNQVVQCADSGNDNQFQTFLNNHAGAVAVDACTGSASLVWTYNSTIAPRGCGSTAVTFTVTDPCGGTASTSAIFTIVDNQNPTFTTAPQSVRVECDGFGNVNDYNSFVASNAGAVASDACATALTITTNAPASGPVGCGVVPVTITAADQCNNAVQATVTYTVQDTNPPVFSSPAVDTSVQCNPTSNTADLNNFLSSHGGAVASDTCYATSSLVWSNNYISLSTQNCTQTARVTFSVVDPCGQRANTTATYSVVDTLAPQLTNPAGSIQLECNSQSNAAQVTQFVQSRGGATAVDQCSTSVVWTNNYVSAPVACGSPLSIVFTAADACGNTVQTTGSVQIVDSTAPVFATFPADVVVGCDQSTDVSITGRPTATDDCTQNVTISFSDSSFQEPQELLCPGDIIVTRTWSLLDACGNGNVRDQKIVQEIAKSTGPCSPSQCPPCEDTVCCTETQERIECNPVPCNPVSCTTVECQSVPCIPQQCVSSPSGVPQGPVPLPSNIPVPSCEPVYIYVFNDDEQDTVSVPDYNFSQQSSGAILKASLLSLIVLVLAVLF